MCLPRTILSLLGESGGLGRASFFFFVATPVTLRFFRVSVPQIITARFLVNFESPCVRCSWCHFSSSTQIPPPKCTCKRHTLLQICSIHTLSLTRFCFHILPLQCHVVYSPKCVRDMVAFPSQLIKQLCLWRMKCKILCDSDLSLLTAVLHVVQLCS